MAIAQSRSASETRPQDSLLGAAGIAVAGGSFVGALIAVVTSTAFPGLADPTNRLPWLTGGAVLSLIHLVVLAGVFVMAATGAVRKGAFKYVAFAVALAGLTAQLGGEAVIRFSFEAGNVLFSIAMPLLGIGMILVGIGVLITGRWTGWRAYAPLACGLYIPVVLVPAFAITHGPSFPALAGFGLVYVALGLAMRSEAVQA
ncbi:MAG TPA: hypothetical protein VGV88_12750 [Candidatus Dormibacteraeota bacterium]|nr:hypothetical protein [Candidatus Dormibacteraeota bacterium]